MEKLDQLVDELLRTHVGGEGYFSTLDARLQLRENLDIVQALFAGHQANGTIVVTGGFGHYIRELRMHKLLPGERSIIHLSGNLRRGDKPRVLFRDADIGRYNYTLVDDSYYSGKTERAVRQFLLNSGMEMNRVHVVYDGSPNKLPHVSSLYRYYDRHTPLARELPLH